MDVTVALTAAEVAALRRRASNFGALVHTIRAMVVATPQAGALPSAPRAAARRPARASNVEPTAGPTPFRRSIQGRNTGSHSGTADPFIWASEDPNDVAHPEDSTDIRADGPAGAPAGSALRR